MSHPDPRRDHAVDLLCDRALVGLDDCEEADLLQLLREFPDLDPEDYERAAALTQLALLDRTNDRQDLPASLRAKILRREPEDFAPASPNVPTTLPLAHRPERSPRLLFLGWLAAAACLILWWHPWSAAEIADPVRSRAALVASASDLVTAPWQALADPASAGLRGDVVFSVAEQRGYLRLEGLAPNDPKVEQYQLWIFDESQSEATPIDGGVFDVTSASAVIEIDAKLPCPRPTAFAVTVEKPGGVVVSSRQRLVALAPIEGP